MPNRYEKIVEHLDKLPVESLFICTAKGACACRGCAGWVNGTRVRDHELKKYMDGTLIPNQIKRDFSTAHQ